jgi:hypothetical protein
MRNYLVTSTNSKAIDKGAKTDNGLQILAVHYQTLFEIEENLNHYRWHDYQCAKRKFVKYLMKSRAA